MSALRSAALCCIVLVSITACSDDADGLDALPCDIRQASCRLAVFAATARERAERPAMMPPSRVITRAVFTDETNAQAARSMTSRADRVLEVSLRLLRFLPAGSSLAQAMAASNIEDVAAYYDDQTRSVTIVEDAVTDAESGTVTLSHEYVHALQDQREGFTNLWRDTTTTDETQAVTTLVEGEAVVLSEIVITRAAGHAYDMALATPYLDQLQSSMLADVAKSDAPFTEALLVLPYPVGARAVSDAFLASGIVGVQMLYQHAPRTALGWVDPARAELLPEKLACVTPDAPAGYQRTGLDSLGSSALLALYTRLGLDGSAAFEAARAWAGDSYAVFAPDGSDSAAALAWRLRLRDEASASDLESKLAAQMPDVGRQRSGVEIVLTAASDPAVLAAWTARNDCSAQKDRPESAPLLGRLRRYLRGPRTRALSR